MGRAYGKTMSNFVRYAVYVLPPPGALADFGAAWLGWDIAAGQPAAHPDVTGVDVAALTATPRKYGLHATVKPPFRLRDGTTPEALSLALDAFCAARKAVPLDGLDLHRIGGFLALVPRGDIHALNALAADTVRELDAFRAPLTDADLIRRRATRLTPAQDALLMRWGYPYVMDEFRFHITLTGRLGPEADDLRARLAPLVAPVLPIPYIIEDLCLVGEADDGRFHLIRRVPLSGA